MRCFIGFELVDTCLERLRQRVEPFSRLLEKDLGWQVRMVPPQNWHMTGLFFQDLTEPERLQVWEEVRRNVGSGAWSALEFPWRGMALWPTPRKPNLVALEAPATDAAQRWPLATRLAEPPFNKGDTAHLTEFRPHITLIRFRGATVRPYGKEWARLSDQIPQVPPSAIRFDRVSLFLSDVSPQKPVYTREYTARL